jgi:plasmid stabilization system protein ParE
MSYSLRWTPESRKTFNQILDYLADEWNTQVVSNFIDQVDVVLQRIRNNPHLYPLHRSEQKVHKCVVHKRVVLYYKIVNDKHIDLLTFWNTYQNPDKLDV